MRKCLNCGKQTEAGFCSTACLLAYLQRAGTPAHLTYNGQTVPVVVTGSSESDA